MTVLLLVVFAAGVWAYWDTYVLTASRGRSARLRLAQDALGLGLILAVLALMILIGRV